MRAPPQVYITVFADGPTRVLRFADAQNLGAEEAEQSVLDLAARLKQVEEQLWRVNAKFSALHGAGGVRDLDLYGRASSVAGTSQAPKAEPVPRGDAGGGPQVRGRHALQCVAVNVLGSGSGEES